jgi:hypothetical protein
MYDGSFHCVPKQWRFPRCGLHHHYDPLPIQMSNTLMKTLWRQLQRKVGPNKLNRRLVLKMLTDMRFLCKHLIELVVKTMGKLEIVITITAVDRMYTSIEKLILKGQRDAQKQWLTVLRQIRRDKATQNINE